MMDAYLVLVHILSLSAYMLLLEHFLDILNKSTSSS
jgi:hypothetical protein